MQEWDPVIQWFCKRFEVDINKMRGLEPVAIPVETKAALQRHLMSYDMDSIHGIVFFF